MLIQFKYTLFVALPGHWSVNSSEITYFRSNLARSPWIHSLGWLALRPVRASPGMYTDRSGSLKAIPDHSGPSRNVSDHSGSDWVIPGHSGPFRTVSDQFGPFRAFSGHPGLVRTISGHGSFRTNLASPDRAGARQTGLEQDQAQFVWFWCDYLNIVHQSIWRGSFCGGAPSAPLPAPPRSSPPRRFARRSAYFEVRRAVRGARGTAVVYLSPRELAVFRGTVA